MYASLYSPKGSCADRLLELAAEFSPAVEQTREDTVVFSIDPLRKLLGSPHQIASEICRCGYEREVDANLAVAANPDSAILLARHFPGVTLVTPGQERFKLAPLAVAALFTQDAPADPKLLQLLHRWGVKTCEELAALPERGVSERLGAAGVYLRNLACGLICRPLRLEASATNYEEQVQLEHPLDNLEPLLFLLGSTLGELCRRLRSQSQAARQLKAQFSLEERKDYRCELEFPVPLDESQTLLKLLQLHLERHPPAAAIVAFTLRVEPAAPRRMQGGFFLPPAPPPDKLQITLARIAGIVGKENVGTPVLLNTHRPDAFEMAALDIPSAAEALHNSAKGADTRRQAAKELADPLGGALPTATVLRDFLNSAKGADTRRQAAKELANPLGGALPTATVLRDFLNSEAAPPPTNQLTAQQTLRLVMRLFRPALPARVSLAGVAPQKVLAVGVKGAVLRSAGPWKTSGEWWTSTAWNREEWDVALDDGALYRIYRELPACDWYVHGVYD